MGSDAAPRSRTAICYVGTAGYLFQTVVSAIQARAASPPESPVVIVGLGDASSDEFRAFGRVCRDNNVVFQAASVRRLDGMSPVFGRMLLSEIIDSDIDQIIYLDGDSQIIGDLTPLIDFPVEEGHMLAARDPMVLLSRVSARFRRRIDRWLAVDGAVRSGYINSGMFKVGRRALSAIRHDMALTGARTSGRFEDQDRLNEMMSGRVLFASQAYNFPGFWLNTRLQSHLDPVVVHFMSEPRPWNAALSPWGRQFHQPYINFVRAYPSAAPYWKRLSGPLLARYHLQQQFKRLRERRIWQSGAASAVLQELEAQTALRPLILSD